MDICDVFPYVITFRVSLPLDEILEAFQSTEVLVHLYLFYLVFLFIIDQVRRWSGEVWAV